MLKFILIRSIILILWIVVYNSLVMFAKWVTYSLLTLVEHTRLAEFVEFFIYDTIKILMLLVLMVYMIGLIRADLNTEKVRSYLKGKNKIIGYFLGAVFGAVTPFCSCSGIPLFIGFTSAHIPLGITMAFLITSPLVNEVAIILLWGMLGYKFTFIYVTMGLLAGIVGGAFIDFIKAEKYLLSFGENKKSDNSFSLSLTNYKPKITLDYRHEFAVSEVKIIFKRVWKWIVCGVGIGAFMHGYIPQEWFNDSLGQGQWWTVPVAVLAGIPLYVNVTGIIPIMESLFVKGLPLGTTLAFCMGAVGASLPEIIMLKQVMNIKLLLIFIGILFILFTSYGWIFNFLQNTVTDFILY